MKISYAILTHNEGECIAELLTLLTTYKRDIDEIVVVDDYSNDEKTKFILNDVKDLIKLEYRTFDGDHTQKNYLNSLCSGDYILQLDADELVHPEFLEMLPELLEENNEIDLYLKCMFMFGSFIKNSFKIHNNINYTLLDLSERVYYNERPIPPPPPVNVLPAGYVTNTSFVPAEKLTREPLFEDDRTVVLDSVVPDDV